MNSSAAIVGIGEVPVRRDRDRSALDIAVTVAEEAIRDSGLSRDEIDVVLVAASFGDRWFSTDAAFARMVDELGLTEKALLNSQIISGGSTGVAMLKMANALITSGQAGAVLCVHAEQFSNLTGQEGLDFFATAGIERQFEGVYGMTFNAMPAFTMQRYMYETGTTIEQIAAVSVSHRAWAALNPNAMFRKPITIEDVLASKVVASPNMTALMANMLGDGGSAFVMASYDRALELPNDPVCVWGEGHIVNTYSYAQHRDMTRMNWSTAGERAFQAAGVKPGDIDIAELYMAYPVYYLLQLEELGFVPRGHAGEFVLRGATMPGGELPMTTNGGATSYGHIGAGVGVATLVESARQLMGKAGERQVDGAEIVLKTGAGGAYSDAHVTILGKGAR
jgi:acetyl-CoA C-acetyltransferase